MQIFRKAFTVARMEADLTFAEIARASKISESDLQALESGSLVMTFELFQKLMAVILKLIELKLSSTVK